MNEGSLTTKGQTTVPAEIRRKMKLKAGDKLYWVFENGQSIVRAKNKTLEDISGMLYRPGQKAVSLEEMDAAIAEGAIDRAMKNDRD